MKTKFLMALLFIATTSVHAMAIPGKVAGKVTGKVLRGADNAASSLGKAQDPEHLIDILAKSINEGTLTKSTAKRILESDHPTIQLLRENMSSDTYSAVANIAAKSADNLVNAEQHYNFMCFISPMDDKPANRINIYGQLGIVDLVHVEEDRITFKSKGQSFKVLGKSRFGPFQTYSLEMNHAVGVDIESTDEWVMGFRQSPENWELGYGQNPYLCKRGESKKLNPDNSAAE